MNNGIRVLILERPFSPTVSFYIRFRHGAAQEREGKTGAAHLLEHMMFKGTFTIGGKNPRRERQLLRKIGETGERLDREHEKAAQADRQQIERLRKKLVKLQEEHRRWYRSNEIDRLYQEAGAAHLNASTSQDMITYHVSLPVNRAELWARIEADRMSEVVFREFYQERNVVLEERRQRIDADPDGFLYERFIATAFLNHPYRRPVIGWPADIARLRMQDLKELHHRLIDPSQMVITVVGAVRPKEMRRLLERYFGALPAHPVERRLIAADPPSRGERLITVRFDAGERLIMGFPKPQPPSREDCVFDVIESLLSRDRTSRFWRILVEERGLAESVRVINGLPGARFPNLFCISARVRHPHRIEELIAALDEQIAKLAAEPVTYAELEKVKNQLRVDYLRRQETNEGIASELSYHEALLGDYRYPYVYEEQLSSITPSDIVAAARKYLVPDNRVLAVMKKPVPPTRSR